MFCLARRNHSFGVIGEKNRKNESYENEGTKDVIRRLQSQYVIKEAPGRASERSDTGKICLRAVAPASITRTR